MRLRVVLIVALLFLALWPSPASSASVSTFNLSDFGAVGDGVTDDGPALQAALDALAASGGGTLFVPAGRYAIVTPVSKDFSGLANSVTIQGVPSSTMVDNSGSGNELSEGLDLQSEFLPQTGSQQVAINVTGLESFLIEHISFAGTPGVANDALVTLHLDRIEQATVRHCEFYGLSSNVNGGAILTARRSRLIVEQSKFLGCTANSAYNTPVLQNLDWKSITVTESTFLDYGQRPELFSKMGFGTPGAWINIGNALAVSNFSPRREVAIRNLFLDEGGFFGLSSLPNSYESDSAKIDLVYVSDLRMNVSNLGASGNYLTHLEAAMIEKARYGWSHNADSAINLLNVGNAIVDQAECLDDANRIRADAATGKLTVINSVYTFLDSEAQTTNAFNTATPEEDPVQYVRQQYQTILGTAPDPAGHYYWSNLILQCGENAQCGTDKRTELNTYLGSSPAPNFSIHGQVIDENGAALTDVPVMLVGSQSVAAQTDASGSYVFSNLPTSGHYTLSVLERHYTFAPPVQTLTAPSGDRVVNFAATLNRHTISGRLANNAGTPVEGATIELSGAENQTATTDADGNYSFTNLPAGGSYTLTPSRSFFIFTPQSNTIDDLDADTNANFSLVTYNITGFLVNTNGLAMEPVTVTLTGPESETTTTTDAYGGYNFFNLPAGGNYTVTPSRDHFAFEPALETINNLSADKSVNFSAHRVKYEIRGRLTLTGADLDGATVTLSGSEPAVTTPDENGEYSFEVTAEGNYTITPSKRHYTFTPGTMVFNHLTASATADFAGALNRHAINGRVVNINNQGLAGATVSLSGSKSATTTTNAAGDYSFANLDAAGNYLVTPSLVHHVFDAPSQSFGDLDSDKYAFFVAHLAYHQISGRVVQSNGTPMSGVTMSLTGTSNGTTTTDAGGNYSFANLMSTGNYFITLTNAKSYTTSSYLFTDLAADQTANFIRKPPPVLISNPGSTRALALDSVLRTKEPFQLSYVLPWSQDRRTRIVLFATDLGLEAGDGVEAINVEVEDAAHRIYQLKVEYVGQVSGFSWLNRIIVRLDDGLGDVGDVLVQLSSHGSPSNRVRVGIGHVGGGLPDDPGAVPTPGNVPAQ